MTDKADKPENAERKAALIEQRDAALAESAPLIAEASELDDQIDNLIVRRRELRQQISDIQDANFATVVRQITRIEAREAEQATATNEVQK